MSRPLSIRTNRGQTSLTSPRLTHIRIATLVVISALLDGCVGPAWIDGPYPPLENPRHADAKNRNEEHDVAVSAEDPWRDLFPKSKVEKNDAPNSDDENDGADDSKLAQQPGSQTDDNSDDFIKDVDSVTMAQVYDELEAVRAIDPELHQQLRDDLRQTDPSIWPMMVKNIRAALAYRSDHGTDHDTHEDVDGVARRDDSHIEKTTRIERATHVTDDAASEEETPEHLASFQQPRKNSLRKINTARRISNNHRRAEGDSVAVPDEQNLLLDPFGDNEPQERDSADDKELAAGENLKNSLPPRAGSPDDSDIDQPIEDANRSWRQQLEVAIAALEAQLEQEEEAENQSVREDPAYESEQVLLHLLYLAAGKSDEAVDGITGLEEDRQLFWSNLMRALRDYMDVDRMPVADRRATRALRDLRDASDSLANLSQLHVDGLSFCSQVESFGRYTEISPYEFEPDQEVLLYVELDHFAAKRAESGDYKTEFEASYIIIDSDGQRVADYTFPTESEVCRNRRRDYFIPFRMWFPKNIFPGEYILQLTVEDKVGKKFGQAQVDFTVNR